MTPIGQPASGHHPIATTALHQVDIEVGGVMRAAMSSIGLARPHRRAQEHRRRARRGPAGTMATSWEGGAPAGARTIEVGDQVGDHVGTVALASSGLSALPLGKGRGHASRRCSRASRLFVSGERIVRRFANPSSEFDGAL